MIYQNDWPQPLLIKVKSEKGEAVIQLFRKGGDWTDPTGRYIQEKDYDYDRSADDCDCDGCCDDMVDSYEYKEVVNERDNLRADKEDLKADLDSLQSKYDELRDNIAYLIKLDDENEYDLPKEVADSLNDLRQLINR